MPRFPKNIRTDSSSFPVSAKRVLAFFFLLSALGCGDKSERREPASTTPKKTKKTAEFAARSFPAMGTVFVFRVQDSPAVPAALRSAFSEISRLEEVLSEWKEDSEISQINRNAGIAPVQVGEDTFAVVKAGLDVSKWSKGAFDLSWAALAGVYDFRPGKAKKPAASVIRKRLALIDYRKIQIDEVKRTVFLQRKGMAIGTGGIAKGYALDKAASILREAGLDNFMIIGGGQVQVHGKPGPRPWRIGIQHPRKATHFASLELESGSVSTSGDYEHSFVGADGKRWHHILDPRTGMPSRSSVAVTIVSDSGLYSDALSTAAFILGAKKAKELLTSIPKRFEAVLVGPDCKVSAAGLDQSVLVVDKPLAEIELQGCER